MLLYLCGRKTRAVYWDMSPPQDARYINMNDDIAPALFRGGIMSPLLSESFRAYAVHCARLPRAY